MEDREAQRIWRLFERRPDGCWVWLGYRSRDGYGKTKAKGRSVLAHRWIYEFLVAPIPDGLTLDHLCRNRACVNPAHLEPVTHIVNMSRSARRLLTHCVRGHEFSVTNTYVDKLGRRQCRTCKNDRQREKYHARKAS